MEDPVQAQVDAYNARDIEAFTAAYHADVVITDASGRAIMSGQETIRDEYGALFEASPDLRAEILGRVSRWRLDRRPRAGRARRRHARPPGRLPGGRRADHPRAAAGLRHAMGWWKRGGRPAHRRGEPERSRARRAPAPGVRGTARPRARGRFRQRAERPLLPVDDQAGRRRRPLRDRVEEVLRPANGHHGPHRAPLARRRTAQRRRGDLRRRAGDLHAVHGRSTRRRS